MSETVTLRARPTVPALGILLVLQSVLQLLDLTTTYFALQNGAVEANPVSRAMIERGGWVAYGGLKVALAMVFVGLWPLTLDLHQGERRFVAVTMGVFATIMMAVVVNNALLL